MQPSLIPLFYAWHATIRFISIGSALPACDFHCSLMSLPKLFKTDSHTIPCSIPYVFPNRQVFERCRASLGHSDRKHIGIAWRGSPLNPMNQQRSMTLSVLLTLHQSNLDFICLQKDVSLDEKKELEKLNIAYHGLELSTMVGTAALIACLDLVITADTSIAHLAAAMGKAVWILLPYSADWRWFLQRDDSPWYPSVKLFRQETYGDWDIPLARIKNALATLQPIEHGLTIENLIQEANQLLQHGLLSEAGQRYRQILIHNPGCHRSANGIALVAFQENNMADAIQFMQLAVEIAPNVMVYRRNLGELLCRAGQLDAAIASHHIAITIEPDHAENHFLLALAYNNNCQFQLAIQHYRIALSYDQHYGLAWNKAILHQVVEQIPNVFTRSFLNQPKQNGGQGQQHNETRCPIFIVGMPRAGTTLIEQILCSHQHIYGAGELSILDDIIQEACHAAGLPFMTWVTQLTDHDFTALGEKYLDETWKLAPDKTFIVDKMPSNCFYIGMIHRMLPTAKIIHAIRDPMDSCFSCFTHLFKTSMLFAYDLTALGDYYLLYAQAMQHWHNVLPSTRLFDLPYEQMVNHHETLTKQLLDYIGLPWDPNCLNFYNNDRIVKTASLTQVRQPIYKTSVKWWQHFSEALQPLLDRVNQERN